MLQAQINTIKFLDGTHIKYLPPNKSYKMLGVHINTILDLKEHLAHLTKDVRIIAKTLARRNLSPPYKTLVIEQLLKSKYHATHLGVFTDPQLTEIDRILNKALRLATGILHNFPTEGVQRPTKEMGLGLPSIRGRATQMGIEHLLNNMNKDTERGYLTYSHTHRLLTQFNHWPTEALESNPLKLPTLRVLRMASAITNLHLDNLPPLTR
jgi:hypothetical protein